MRSSTRQKGADAAKKSAVAELVSARARKAKQVGQRRRSVYLKIHCTKLNRSQNMTANKRACIEQDKESGVHKVVHEPKTMSWKNILLWSLLTILNFS